MDRAELTGTLKAYAIELGFNRAGACPAVAAPGRGALAEWLARGYAGEMRYLPDRADAYEHPRAVLDGVRSLLMLTLNYRTAEPSPAATGQGRVSRYAWGHDYHDLIHARLAQLIERLRELAPDCRARGVVDTAPLLERQFAQLAGLGWLGKNTLLLNRQDGSWLFLAALLTDVELDYDQPFAADHCGTCRACLDACPTDAFPEPYVLDARRCISYLTIELRAAVPEPLRAGMGDWLFGCDVCQDVCPWNSHAPRSDATELAPRAGQDLVDLAALLTIDDDAFRRRFRSTPLWRAKRRGLLRNAAVVLGNQRAVRSVPTLARALDDHEPLVRGACAWALGRCGGPQSVAALRRRLEAETDDEVRREIAAALRNIEA